MWLLGKHLFVVGGSSGIGKELVVRGAACCSKISILSSSTERISSARAEFESLSIKNAEYHVADVRDASKIESIINSSGQIDAFVYSAGGTNHYGPFEDYDVANIENIININLTSVLTSLRFLLPKMKYNLSSSDKKGHVILLSSRSGERALPGLCPYAAAKGGLERLADGLQKEYAQYGLAFTLVCPGSIETAFTALWDNKNAHEKHMQESMKVDEVGDLLMSIINFPHIVNRISFESVAQWKHEPGASCG